MATPYATLAFRRVTSTQDVALAAYLERGGAVLVVADEQTAGRGRSGRPWLQATESLASSLAVAVDWPLDRLSAVTLAAGLAVRDALGAATQRPVTVKWPNDVVIESEKLAGILVELKGDVVVAGCGANLYWPDRPDGTVALYDAPTPQGEAVTLATAWVDRFLERVGRGPDDWGREEYSLHCSTLGAEVTWHPAGVGRAVAIGEDGSLIVDVDGTTKAIYAGEVEHVRPANVALDPASDDGESAR